MKNFITGSKTEETSQNIGKHFILMLLPLFISAIPPLKPTLFLHLFGKAAKAVNL